MEERIRRESSKLGEISPKYFVYTSETNYANIPRTTLTHVRVDSSVTEISDRPFNDCKTLMEVQLPDTLIRIAGFAFALCFNLKCVQFVSDAALDASSSINPNLEDGTIVFPERAAILHVDGFAFAYCHGLRGIIVRSVSTELDSGAFSHCSGLVSVELPEGLQVIEDLLFSSCVSLTTVKIPSSVIKIGRYAFSTCRSLTTFELPYGLMEIGEGAFCLCDSIETIQIPAPVSSIGKGAFQECPGVKYIKLPPTMKKIEIFEFEGCHGLENIKLPATMKKMDYRCPSIFPLLSHIRIPKSDYSIGLATFLRRGTFTSIELPEDISLDLDLSRCNSLVNIAAPKLDELEIGSLDDFMQDSKLGSVVHGYDDLVRRLKHRFDDSPLNKLCYYQSYYSTEDAMVQLRSLMYEDPLGAVTQVDEFGMTPLHILSLSQSPNLDMISAVMKGGHPDHMIHCKDSFGSTPMDYLCSNRIPNFAQVIRTVLQTRFDLWLGSDRSWESDMWQAVDEASAVCCLSSKRSKIGQVYFDFANYERKEILSLVELYLWKRKIDEVSSMAENTANRQCCRINSGASIVIPHVLPFLAKLDEKDYFTDFQEPNS
eukprot:scaffold10675_cov89-Cylindrotheca_fusiformis.AAC.1